MGDDERMLTVQEAAAELGISVPTLWRHIKKGELVTFRRFADKRAYLRGEDIDRLKGFTREATS